MLTREHPARARVLLLVLPKPPPVPVQGLGRLPIRDAVLQQLEAVHARASNPPPLDGLRGGVDSTCAWITWSEIDQVLVDGRFGVGQLEPSAAASVSRTADAGRRAIAFHS